VVGAAQDPHLRVALAALCLAAATIQIIVFGSMGKWYESKKVQVRPGRCGHCAPAARIYRRSCII